MFELFSSTLSAAVGSIARASAQRLRQTGRLKDAAPPNVTRQQRRALARKAMKTGSFTPTQRAYMVMKGHLPDYPKGTFAH